MKPHVEQWTLQAAHPATHCSSPRSPTVPVALLVCGSGITSVLSPQLWPPPQSWWLLHVCQHEYQHLLAGEEVSYQAWDFWNMILGFLH